MDFKNFFQWQPDVNGRPTVRVNGGKFHNVGIEAEYSRHLSDRLKMSVSGSYSNPKQKEMNETYWKQAAPKLQFTTGIRYEAQPGKLVHPLALLPNVCAIVMVA